MEKSFYGIFKTFFKVGTLLLGGGYVILPLLTNELVEKKKWLSADELVEYYSISSSLPGIIAANTAIFTGRKILGTKGAIAAILGMITSPFLAIILLASVLNEIAGYNFVKYIFWGVSIGVITLLFLAVKEMWSKAVCDKFSVIVYLIALIFALSGKIPLALIIIIAVLGGIFYQVASDRRNVE